MKRKLGGPFLLFLFAFWTAVTARASAPGDDTGLQDIEKWVILLGYDPDAGKVTAEALEPFDLVILDPDTHPPLEWVKDDALRVAYVSLGEAEDYRAYWKEIKNKPWIVRENPDWKGNYYVDVRNSEWQEVILERVIAAVVSQGFDGIFMDTLDTADYLESQPGDRYAGSRRAMIDFVKKIRERYPDLILISNNGFPLLQELAPFLDAVLVEDIYWQADFEKNTYKEVTPEDRDYKVGILKKVLAARELPVFNVDYAAKTEKETIQKCIRDSKKLGFKPYVAEKDLSEIYAQ